MIPFKRLVKISITLGNQIEGYIRNILLVHSYKIYVYKLSLTLYEKVQHTFCRRNFSKCSSFSMALNVYNDVLRNQDLVQLYYIYNINIEVCNRRRISTSVTTTSITAEAQAHSAVVAINVCHHHNQSHRRRCPTVCSSHPLRLVLYYTNQQQFIYNKQILDVIAVFLFSFFSCVRMWSSPLPYDDVG